MIGVIGGSGFEKFSQFQSLENLPCETPFGLASSGLKRASANGHEFLFLPRHGEQHEYLPSEVNFAANIWALKAHGAKAILSFSSVGSLQKELAPGHVVMPDQFIDRTKGLRRHTYSGQGIVSHISMGNPVCGEMYAKAFEKLKSVQEISLHINKSSVCIEGPSFSTRSESKWYRQMELGTIGMTACPEVKLAREASLPYLSLQFVTDYDSWDDSRGEVTIEEILRIIKGNNQKAFTCLEALLDCGDSLYKASHCYRQGLPYSLLSKKENLTDEQKQILEFLS